jgi:hypothetical protein
MLISISNYFNKKDLIEERYMDGGPNGQNSEVGD